MTHPIPGIEQIGNRWCASPGTSPLGPCSPRCPEEVVLDA